MRPKFLVLVTSRFERELDVLLRRHRELADHYGFVLDVLKTDPYNQTRAHPIKKLTAVQTGKGQYRIRAERFRFRYDIEGLTVYLKACSLRREATYDR